MSDESSKLSSEKASGKLLDLTHFRQKRDTTEKISPGRTPLFVSHLDGKVKGSPHLNANSGADGDEQFGDRLQRIRASLERINRLMSELKQLSMQDGNNGVRS